MFTEVLKTLVNKNTNILVFFIDHRVITKDMNKIITVNHRCIIMIDESRSNSHIVNHYIRFHY